ncbi:DEAD/DEAH box helicase [bacterium]|nr:DEAD/DEAH box helicase [bacterium]
MNEDMIREQIERRRQRGLDEIAKIVNQGDHPVYSTFEVQSTSENAYRVQIRSLTELLNTCSCPDYRCNMIGTCKHIEGVLGHLQEKYKKQWQKLIAEAPTVTQLYVRHAAESTVQITRPLPNEPELLSLLDRYFDAEGLLVGKVTQTLPVLLTELANYPPEMKTQVRIDPNVYEYLEKQQTIESVDRQKQWFLDQIKAGNRSLNVLSTKLYPFQEEGVLHLTFSRRALLADDMGLGKTIQAIAAAALIKQLRDIKHVLIVAPASLKHQWAREIKRFTSLSVQVIQGPRLERRNHYRHLHFFNIINYELVRFDREELTNQNFDLIILDEAQRIKNWRTQTAISVKQLQSPFSFVLTGTPLENRLDELFSIFQYIDSSILGPLWAFNERYYVGQKRPSGSYKVLGHHNLDELRQRIAPYTLRRVRDQVRLDLPERIDNNYFVEMTALQRTPYSDFEFTVARLMAIAQKRPLSPAEHRILMGSLVKMRLLCNALALHDPEVKSADVEKTSPKLQELREILSDEIAPNGHKAIIFSQWSMMLHLVERLLDKMNIGHVTLSGDVPSPKRGALIERFFDDPQCKVFLSTDAGGVGLNLQAASLVINLDLPWNPAVLEQRIARAHRHGQRYPVNVINLIAKDTIEERILDTLAAKRTIFEAALSHESEISELTFDQLGTNVLQRLEVLLGDKKAEKLEVQLEPVQQAECPSVHIPVPTLQGFSDLIVTRFPARIMLVRKAPRLTDQSSDNNLLIVVDREPAELRPAVEQILAEYYALSTAPRLLFMEQEGYKALMSLTGQGQAPHEPNDVVFISPAQKSGLEDKEEKARLHFLDDISRQLELAEKRLKLARVVLEGGFPEEGLAPIRQSLTLFLTAFLGLVTRKKQDGSLPSARLIETELVKPDCIGPELAARLDRIRSLTTPLEETETAPPPLPEKTGQELLSTLEELNQVIRTAMVQHRLQGR